MVESAENWIGSHTVYLHKNIKYIQTLIILCYYIMLSQCIQSQILYIITLGF